MNRPERAVVAMTGPVRVAYDELIAANELKPDPAQERAVAALDRLAASIGTATGLLARLFGHRSDGPPASICGAASAAENRC